MNVILGALLLLTLTATGQSPQAAGQSLQTGTLADYVFTCPPGWTPTQYSDGIVLNAPVSNTGEKCVLTLWPMRTPSANLAADAVQAFREVFKAFVPRNSEYATRNSIIRGVSAQGWEYFMIKNAIQPPNGNYQIVWGFVFVAGLGNRLAMISGISKDPLVSSCFGLNLTDVWPKFFYSLQFKGWSPTSSARQLMRRMAGVWTIATATAADRWVFAPNGRYASAAAAQRYVATSYNEILSVTDAYFGNGSYTLNGASILLTEDNDKSNPKKGLIRLEQESYDNGNTWTDKLYLLRTSTVDGKEYEVAYSRPR
ncbi:MAG TPA: hypothetical protein VHE34_01490 [Puia sp.]|uniref:hypothetical protein n=1 Tax=Puia sp. TaxID=2045100 RepID=UPI002BF383F8|nr:hypothetical protein [Puia sp.]HVU93858.1 hypothetical protein [Puia sp.]